MELSFVTSLEEVTDDTRLLWLCNPNNPTGMVHPKGTIVDFVERHPNTVAVIDQSYAFFTHQEVWTAREALQHKNVLLLHSMTKRYAVPGLRLGYVTSHESLLARLREYSMPWSVNQLAVEAGKYLLAKNDISLQLSLSEYLAETKRLMQELSGITGLTVMPSAAHFFLCRLSNGKAAAELKAYLATEHGMLIRDGANFRGLDERYFRIATQTAEENNRLVKAVKEWM
jgi:threonine-phosphate decarboxylase